MGRSRGQAHQPDLRGLRRRHCSKRNYIQEQVQHRARRLGVEESYGGEDRRGQIGLFRMWVHRSAGHIPRRRRATFVQQLLHRRRHGFHLRSGEIHLQGVRDIAQHREVRARIGGIDHGAEEGAAGRGGWVRVRRLRVHGDRESHTWESLGSLLDRRRVQFEHW
ncbi:unnamed protein product [Linum tenue]|uniref:Uncharacterized protein n=1 Tax=Linum tenue TaxID=586396 RepID=A0AAV0LUY5_9ROSI|nr:unnamed protein product [Linum tenue]